MEYSRQPKPQPLPDMLWCPRHNRSFEDYCDDCFLETPSDEYDEDITQEEIDELDKQLKKEWM